jgi:hypothetical protein
VRQEASSISNLLTAKNLLVEEVKEEKKIEAQRVDMINSEI